MKERLNGENSTFWSEISTIWKSMNQLLEEKVSTLYAQVSMRRSCDCALLVQPKFF